MRWAWLIGVSLLLVAAGSVWFAFHSPTFVAGLVAFATAAAWKALAPTVAKAVGRAPPDEEAAMRQAEREGRGDEFRKNLWKWRRDHPRK